VGRPIKEIEVMREDLEGQLACLGSALNLLDLVTYRVGSAIEYIGQRGMLNPALEDIDNVKQLLTHTQGLIKSSNPHVFGGK